MRKLLSALLLLPLLIPLLLPGAASAQSAHVIIQKGRAFNPREVTIAKGTTLAFTNNDEFIHQIYSTDLFDTDEKAPGQVLNETFSQAGTFEVHCHIHPRMKLIVHVN